MSGKSRGQRLSELIKDVDIDAADYLAKHLNALDHPSGKLLRLVQFDGDDDSDRPGAQSVRKLKLQVAEAVINQLHHGGFNVKRANR